MLLLVYNLFCCNSDNKNSVETTCLNIRLPRLHFLQVVPRRIQRRFTNYS